MTTYTWKTAGLSGNFETTTDWTPTAPTGGPGSGDDALLTATGTYTVTTTATDAVNSLQTAAGATLAVGANLNFTMNNGTESVAFPSGANAGQITLANNVYLFMGGTFNNTSTVASGGLVLNGSANLTALRVAAAGLSLTGGGSVVLGTAGNNAIFGATASSNTLTNVNNTISGVGNIGDGELTLVNHTAGKINANQTSALELDVNGGVTNTGLLEATNTGGLLIASTGITNTNGTIEATGAGAHVDLQSSYVAGGSLTSTAGAQVDLVANTNSTLDGSTSAGAATITSGSNLNLNNNAYLYIYGSIVNDGTINILGGANVTGLRIGEASAPTTTLTGGGNVVLGGGGNNYIFAANNAAQTLVNVNNTISGVGIIGNGELSLINQTAGVINANQTSGLELNVGGSGSIGVQNTGTLEASNTGGLQIVNAGIDNEGNSNAGKISATVSGAHVDLQASSVAGGTLSAVAGAYIDVVANQNAYLEGQDPGAPVNITAGTNLDVNNNANLYLYGTINNQGTINVNGVGNNTEIRITTPVVTLTGGGQVVLASGPAYIFATNGYANELLNVNNTISGEGTVGNGELTLVNQTAGVIDANQASALTLNPNDGVINTGVLESTSTGGLTLLNVSVDNTQSNGTKINSGQISATGTGSHVDLQNAYIYGGTITTAPGDFVDVVAGQSAYFYSGSISNQSGTYAPVTITAGSNVDINNNANLYLSGTVFNSGTINLGVADEANNTEIRLNSPVVTLTTATPTVAGGVIQLSTSPNNYIFATSNYSQTLNNVNNTIQGSGNIGNGDMSLINGKLGVIDANQAADGMGNGGELTLQVNDGVTNAGIIESNLAPSSSVGGTLFILNTTITNTGKIEANGATVNKVAVGTTVLLQNSTIVGGTLSSTTKNPSAFDVVSGQTATLSGGAGTITVGAVVNDENNSTLVLAGNVSTNKGTINLLGVGNATFLTVGSSTVTLSGSGTIDLAGSGNNYVTSNNGYQALVNTNNLIEGAGNIGNGGDLELVNSGTVNANNATLGLTIQAAPTVENNGLIESTAAGGLFVLNSSIDNTYPTSTGVLNAGKITATGKGHVDLQNSNIYGGTLTATGTAFIDVVAGQSAGLNGTVYGQPVNIAAGTNFDVNNNSTLYLEGTIANAGTITLEGAANATYLDLNYSDEVLTGGGNLVLGGTGNDYIQETVGNCELDNVNNTISGSGNIGNGGQMSLTNEAAGVIDALAGGITINLGGVEVINSGTLEATAGALSITNSVENFGAIKANGGNVSIGGNIDGTGAIDLFGSSGVEIGYSYGGAAAQSVTFESGSTGTFKIDNAQYFTGTVTGFGANTSQAIDLGNINIATASIVGYNAGTGVLTVTDGTTLANITFVGTYTLGNFTLKNDGANHTDIIDPPVKGPKTVNQLVAAMAAMGGGSSSANLSSATASHANSLLLAMPHAV